MTDSMDASSCPLCGQNNSCGNLGNAVSDDSASQSCWCAGPALSFPEELLKHIPKDLKNKACVCQSCVKKFQVSE